MRWPILYHHMVEEDLENIGPSVARRIVKAIDEKLTLAPNDFGATLSGTLSNFRKLRVGDYRTVYEFPKKTVAVYMLAVGPAGTRRFTGPP